MDMDRSASVVGKLRRGARTRDPAQYAVMTSDNERKMVASKLQHASA